MSEPSSKSYDCVQSMREIRDRLSEETADMSYEELTVWLRDRTYSDPLLERLADRACRVADAEDPRARRR